MAKAFVVGHGGYNPNGRNTWVPPDMSVSYYTELNDTSFLMMIPNIVSEGGIKPTQVYPAGSEIENHMLTPLEATDGAAIFASLPRESKNTLYLVGAERLKIPDGERGLRLCTKPGRCTATGHRPDCGGLFVLLKATKETDLHIISCRIATARARDGRRPLADVDPARHLVEWQVPKIDTTPTGRKKKPVEATRDLANDVLAMERQLLSAAVMDPYAALGRVRSMSAAAVATLRGAYVLPIWMELTENPLTPSSPPSEILAARAKVLNMQLDRIPSGLSGEAIFELFKRALPKQTQAVLFHTPPPLLQPHPTLSDGWADMPTRNDFQEWLASRERSTVTLGLCSLYNTARVQRRKLGDERPVDALRQLVLSLRSPNVKAILGEAGLGGGHVDPRFVSEAKQLLELYTTATRPKVTEGQQPAQVAVDASFTEAVGDLLSALESRVVEQLTPHYDKYLLDRHPDDLDQRYVEQLLAD